MTTNLSLRAQQALWEHFEHNWTLPAKVRRELRYLLGKDPYVQEPKVDVVYRAGGPKGRSWTKSCEVAQQYADVVGGRRRTVQEHIVKPGEFVDADPLYGLLGLERHWQDREVIYVGDVVKKKNPKHKFKAKLLR